MRVSSPRRGVASVVGTVFFVLVFVVALGSMAYAAGVQEQAAAAQQSAEESIARRGAESLAFTTEAAGLFATDSGPGTVVVNHVILKFPNGTVYPLAVSAAIPAGGSLALGSLIPAGLCAPGAATCMSKYEGIVSGNPPGSSVGVVTSMGNSFWYVYAASQVSWSSLTGFPQACPAGQAISKLNSSVTCSTAGALVSRVRTDMSTSGIGVYSSTGLAVNLAPNTSYVFYAFTAIEPRAGIENYNFEIHTLPAGAALVIVCAPMSYPFGGANQPTNCVSAAVTPIVPPNNLGFGITPPVFATPGLFGVVTLGSTGRVLQIDFACTAYCGGVVMKAGSFIVAQPVA